MAQNQFDQGQITAGRDYKKRTPRVVGANCISLFAQTLFLFDVSTPPPSRTAPNARHAPNIL